MGEFGKLYVQIVLKLHKPLIGLEQTLAFADFPLHP